MKTANAQSAATRIPATRLWMRMLNVLASPGEVFDEVLTEPARSANWLVPTLIVVLTTVACLSTSPGQMSPTANTLPGSIILAVHSPEAARDYRGVASAFMALGAVAGVFWAAFLLWCLGRMMLKVRFSFLKSLEIVGLSSVILALGTILTALLIAASGDVAARPTLSWFAGKTASSGRLGMVLETMNLFHVWTAVVLASGLSKLSGVSFKEAAFWVFGYWLLFRAGLVVLG